MNGTDQLSAGIPEGAEIGKAINTLFEMVISGQAENDKAQLLKIAAGRLNKGTKRQ